MVFITVEKINAEKGRVVCRHNHPNMLSADDLKTGLLVEEVNPTDIDGKISVPYYNYITNTLYYEYTDAPKTDADRIAILEKEKSDLQIALAESIEQQAKDKLELQTSMAELIESMDIGGTV